MLIQQQSYLNKETFDNINDRAITTRVKDTVNKSEVIPYNSNELDQEMIDKQIEGIGQNKGKMVDVNSIKDGSEYIKGELIELNAENKSKEDGIVNEDASMSLHYMKDEESKKAFMGKKVGEEVIFDAVKSYPNKADFAAMLGINKKEAEGND